MLRGVEDWSRLQERLLVIVTLALSPFLIFAGLEAYSEISDVRDERREALYLRSEKAIGEIEAAIAQSSALLIAFTDDIAAGRCGEVAAKVEKAAGFIQNIVYFDGDGQASCTAKGELGFSITDPVWHERLRAGEHVIRTGAFYSKATKQWIIGLLRRVENSEGEFMGSVGLGVGVNLLLSEANMQSPDTYAGLGIADAEGQAFGDLPWPDVPVRWMTREQEEHHSILELYRTDDGERYDVVIAALEEAQLWALIAEPSPSVWSVTALRPVSTVGIPLLVFISALLSVWIGLDRLVLRWLRPLRRMAVAYADARYEFEAEQDFEHAPKELARLAHTLERMAGRIGERDAELRAALEVKEAAVREIHHRVKNNLQIVNSFVSLQSRGLQDRKAKQALSTVKHRIDALSIVHQTLYQHERLEIVAMQPFFASLLGHLNAALGMDDVDVHMDWDIAEIDRPSDDAIPLALFVLEAVTNCMKFAFQDRGGKIHVSFYPEEEHLMLIVRDDGAGEDAEISSENSTGLGSKLMKAFAKQVKGTVTAGPVGRGYEVQLRMPF